MGDALSFRKLSDQGWWWWWSDGGVERLPGVRRIGRDV